MQTSTPLDAFTLPFSGARLIEASAGTGKTYTIANLYLRLLLGIGEQRPFKVEEILVVTFTNAATSELRDRIRRRIQDGFRLCLGEPSEDSFLTRLLEAISDRQLALRQLDLALKTLDEAAIYTIHGFCQRVLSDMAFESALLFESEFTLDDSELLAMAAADFWRAHCYPLSADIAALIQEKFASPKALERELKSLLGARDAAVDIRVDDFNELASGFSARIARLRLAWQRQAEETLAALSQLPLNGVSYGKAADGFPKLRNHWDAMEAWVLRGDGMPPEKSMQALAYGNIKLNKGGQLPAPEALSLLVHIEALLQAQENLLPAFLVLARDEIRERFDTLKAERNLMAPDDLLKHLAKALGVHGASSDCGPVSDIDRDIALRLSREVASRFPMALIDEFQDTDPLQFAIFSALYRQQPKAQGLLMIGDPKQAIYAFRGGDIHTYLGARRAASAHYSLGTNYRSSSAMVKAVNAVFSARERVFLSDEIPFEAVEASDKGTKRLLIDGKPQGPALEIALLGEDPDKGLNKQTARTLLAEDAAAHIGQLLSLAAEGRAVLTDRQRPLLAKDIAVLVRDRNEAAFIKDALTRRNIGAVFLSRDNVFATKEASELLHVLAALAQPRDEKRLRAAMATRLMGWNLSQIAAFNQDEDARRQALECFERWHQRWQRQGVMPALMAFADDTRLLQRLGGENDADRRLTDFRHLCELLEQAAASLDGISALVGWFEQALLDPGSDEAMQLRLESEQNLVQIVTIHKSKGLEYGLCYIPFLSLARDSRGKPSPLLYHKDERLVWDLLQSDDGVECFDTEHLGEDLRLLYVALTRPVYGCRLGLANHSRMLKAGISSEVHKTALGFVLGIDSKDCDFAALRQAAERVCSHANGSDIMGVVDIIQNDLTPLESAEPPSEVPPSPRTPNRIGEESWRVGSYSALIAQGAGHTEHHGDALWANTEITMPAIPGAADESFSPQELPLHGEESEPELTPALSRFSFPRGANAGSFMHQVLELIRFDAVAQTLPEVLPDAMAHFGIETLWQPVLEAWYEDLMQAQLDDGSSQFSLGALAPANLLVEMEFYLPVSRLKPGALGDLLALYGYRSDFGFDTLNGMLKGFIDLCFSHNGRFYIADYKSNHLGDTLGHYHRDAMHSAIQDHHYDLQYLLYTLALHRLLRSRLAHYDYDKDIGGCFYLFLRGMSASVPGSGVFFDKPPKLLIEALDALFEGQEIRL
ncbi:exodeoxyribonuclease V subunit beta [Shewanella litorisediminis]|uniref:RecBCD enzyme subunit RecB n=1 Tax=Shewanella litorisediminis TaxID=1173586 RepID=A0ABX7FYS0_9GAMM|nr:exodeoxyribonuclease V subunit beta [Shewanella litorisediminis]MCL2918842.1 exodeoxyribonuclease V subunit beta [Shewanella litorisediminis]QRH00191.1 exodeoxyribonuclease V subunit beta [Shewanella litorisediminis]